MFVMIFSTKKKLFIESKKMSFIRSVHRVSERRFKVIWTISTQRDNQSLGKCVDN